MLLSIKYFLTFALVSLCCAGLSGQKAIDQAMKIDSVYGYKTISLEASYASVKHLLGPKQVINAHEYCCTVTDASYLKSNLLTSQTISLDFFDDKVRSIVVRVQDSLHVAGVLADLIHTYGTNYGMPSGQQENSLTRANDQSFDWSGKKSSVHYTVFCYPIRKDSMSWNGNVTFKSRAMECYASKVLGEKYWPEEEGNIRCPRIDPCTQ